MAMFQFYAPTPKLGMKPSSLLHVAENTECTELAFPWPSSCRSEGILRSTDPQQEDHMTVMTVL